MADRAAPIQQRTGPADGAGAALVDAYATGRFADLEARLMTRFCPPLRPEEVQRHLVDVIASFDGAPVRAYLPILVERVAVRRLADALAARPPRRTGAGAGPAPTRMLVAPGGSAR